MQGAADSRLLVAQDHLRTGIRGRKCGRKSRSAGADHQHVAMDVAA